MNLLTFVAITAFFAIMIDGYVLPYSPDEFNKVNDFMDIYYMSKEQAIIDQLGLIIKKHKMSRHVTLQLLHTHFKIDDEIIVEKMTHNESLTKPIKINNIDMTTIVPYLFKFTRDGNVIPLEYVKSSKFASVDKMERTINMTIADNSTAFVKDFVSTLLSLDVIDIFGIGISHRDHISNSHGGHTTENSDSIERFYHVVGTVTKTNSNSTGQSCSHSSCTHGCASHCSMNSHSLHNPIIQDCSHHSCTHGCASHCSMNSHALNKNKPKIQACAHQCSHHCNSTSHNLAEKTGVQACAHQCSHHCNSHNLTNQTKIQACAHQCSHHCNSTSHNHDGHKEDEIITVQVGWSFV